MTQHKIRKTFQRLKYNKIVKFNKMSRLEQYYICKAHKIVNAEHMFHYWDKVYPSKTILRKILKAYYPPLEYNHSLDKGFKDLSYYVYIAYKIFK